MAMEIIPGPNLTVPTAPAGDSSNRAASTQFVSNAVASSLVAVAFSVDKNSVDQTGILDSTFTTITWSNEVYDIGGYFASNGWTPPAGKISLVAAFLMGGTIAAGAQASIAIFKNGNDYKQGNWPALTNLGTALIVIEDNASGSDVYTVGAFIDLTSGSGTITGNPQNTYFMGHWIGS